MSNTPYSEDIVEKMSDAFYSLTEDLKIEYINNVTERLLKIKREKVIGKYIYDVLPHNDTDNFVKRYKKLLSDQKPVEFKEYFNRKWYEMRAFPTKTGLAVFFKDITVQKQDDEKINRFKLYSSYEEDVRFNPLKIEFHKAIESNQLLLYYQPRINLKTGKVTGMEALVAPETFILAAEESEVITSIGTWILYTVCKQNKKWHKQGFSTVVSVNLSTIQLTQADFIKAITTVLQTTELDASFLEIEFPEMMTSDIESTILMLQQLKKLGVRICIANFGERFCSLSYLRNSLVDTLKIDQSFVREICNNPNDEMIVKTIISIAHNLNLNVVAEGIETKEQLVFLKEHLCDEGCGSFLSKPLAANELEGKLSDIQQIVEKPGIFKDINERVSMEELLGLAKKELHDTVRLQQGMIFKFKKINGRFIHTLSDGELMYRFGFVPSQVIGKSLEEFIFNGTAVKIASYYQKAWEGEEFVSYENELNGIHYLVTLRPIKEDGRVIEVIGSCIDITARKEAEDKWRESEKRYKIIAENLIDIIMLLDGNGTILYASPSLGKALGFPLKLYEGENAFDLIHPEDKQRVIMAFEQSMETMILHQMEARFLDINKKSKLFEGLGTPVIGENGGPGYFIVVGRDITEKRRTEEILSKAEKLAVVGELAAGVAHEIRNPLTSIKGFIQLFQQGMIKREFFEIIFGEFLSIEEILKEFINLAKPQEIQVEKLNLKALLKDVEILLKSEQSLKNVQISQEYKQELPEIMCDRHQIKQVFIHIIRNSIEAIPDRGYVKIQGSAEGDNVLIEVIDNGIGMSKERIKRLGEPFYSNKEKGTGLGLMLCFRIVQQHNGTIRVKSKENYGTTVEVRLPIKCTNKKEYNVD
ncbi:EAL domain-containing protein [Metabacillus fastidiosus]|uniref:EAL domain-containing protein n=1 Tax=Metabacillus fastidiosus TaxID=1458 RepID=UPI002DB7CF37|nr:EAL domain-containing protein [Metabacillus fastidiosus]MEC2076350.1 EAL domain-containing protein [Metabacillus fastidiosus]